MRIPLPLIVALVIGMSVTFYVKLYVIPPPFIPAEPRDIVLNLSESQWVVVGPFCGHIIRVVSNVSMDVILGEASAVAVYLPAMPYIHASYHGFGGRYHVINKSGVYAVVANEVCFAGRAVRQPSGIIAIMPGPISTEDYDTYLSVCGVVDGVGLWNGRIDVVDGQPPTMVFFLHGGGVARGAESKEEFGRWEFPQWYVANTTYVDFIRGPRDKMYGRNWNGTMYYENIWTVAWVAVKPRGPAQIRIIVRYV
jgi:hypothetical protein